MEEVDVGVGVGVRVEVKVLEVELIELVLLVCSVWFDRSKSKMDSEGKYLMEEDVRPAGHFKPDSFMKNEDTEYGRENRVEKAREKEREKERERKRERESGKENVKATLLLRWVVSG